MLPKLRRSLQKNDQNRKSPPSAPVPVQAAARKSGGALEAPKAVIRALYDYQAANPEELTFNQGDFFHVVGSDTDVNW